MRPPVDPHRSGTRREERLLQEDEIAARAKLRATLTGDVIEDAAKLVTAATTERGARRADG